MLQQKMINFIYICMYIRENNQESIILAYMDYINELFFFHIGIPLPYLTAHNWQKWKRVFLTCLCHKIYRDEAVGLKSCKYTWKITILVKMWNLGQNRENLIFCQYLLNWSSNLKILLPMFDKYNCDYLKHSTFRFNLINIQLNTDFPSQFCVFYRKIT